MTVDTIAQIRSVQRKPRLLSIAFRRKGKMKPEDDISGPVSIKNLKVQKAWKKTDHQHLHRSR